MTRAESIADFRSRAARRLPRAVFDYIDGAADGELTAKRNEEAFDEIAVIPRMLCATPQLNTSCDLFGTRINLPILMTPTGFTGIVRPRGELAVARASARAGTVMVVSAATTISLEEIAVATSGAKWFQLFIYKDRGITLDLAARAKQAGYGALVVTVDVQAPGKRYRDLSNGFTVPPRIGLANAIDMMRRPGWLRERLLQPRVSFPNFERYGKKKGMVSIGEWLNELIDPSVCWKDLEWLRSHWNGPLVVKGVLHPDDARRARDVGADAVIVSNHGGRQMDTEPATIDVLPHVVDAVDDRFPVLIDGGIRRGTDVLKCLSLGARCCLIGRPYLWGLGGGGEEGIDRVMAILRDELVRALAHIGCDDIASLGRRHVVQRNSMKLAEHFVAEIA